LQSLIDGLIKNVTDRLEKGGVKFGNFTKYATYRRLSFIIDGLDEKQDDKNEEVKGPPAKIAVNEDGSYTKAGEGFLKKFGAKEADVSDGYLYVKVFEKGKKTAEILPNIIVDSLANLYLPVAMKWGTESQKFYRPVHWIISLLDDKLLPLSFAGIEAENISKGHRFLSNGNDLDGADVLVESIGKYAEMLRKKNVEPSFDKRKSTISAQASKLTGDVVLDEELLNEVAGLVECPKVLQGEFESDFLSIPEKILITSMKKHQKYFPVMEDGKLTNKFLITADNVNDKNSANIVKGNEKVLQARLCDAEFFYKEDMKHDFSFFNEQLKAITFQKKLGSVSQKVERNVATAEYIIDKLKLEKKAKDTVLEIVKNAKADLSTQMVNEFADLQGYIGQQYALKWGEAKEIADGIYEHYLPAFAGDALPSSIYSSIASVADKMDTIVGQFAIGKIPSGSQDPFALRRQANGIVRIFYETDYFQFSLYDLIKATLQHYKDMDVSAENIKKLFAFFEQRIEQYLKDAGIALDIIQTITTLDLVLLKKRLNLCLELNKSDKQKLIIEAAARVINITKDVHVEDTVVVDPFLFEDSSERSLYDGFKIFAEDKQWDASLIKEWAVLAAYIGDFFDEVMVMVEDDKVKANRLSMLFGIKEYFNQFGDLRLLQV